MRVSNLLALPHSPAKKNFRRPVSGRQTNNGPDVTAFDSYTRFTLYYLILSAFDGVNAKQYRYDLLLNLFDNCNLGFTTTNDPRSYSRRYHGR